jgi:hypothetical protein
MAPLNWLQLWLQLVASAPRCLPFADAQTGTSSGLQNGNEL